MRRVPRPWVRKRPGPADEDDEPVREADQVEDVDPEPQQPGGEPALPPERAEPADVGDPGEPPDDRDVAVVAVAVRLVRPAEDAAADDLRGVGAALHRALRDARRRLVRLPRLTAASPTTKISGWPGIVRSGSTMTRPDAIGRGPGRLGDGPREARAEDARGPEDGPGRDGLLRPVGRRRRGHRPRRRSTTRVRRPDLDPELLELALRRRRSIGRIRRQDPIHRLDQDDPGLVRPDRPEVALERVVGDLAQRAGQLDPGRAAADQHERHPRPAPLRVGFALGGLEGDQDPPPDLGRVLDRLEPGRDRRPLGVVEVGVVGAGRDDERVVGDRAAVGEQDLAPLGVDADRLAEDDRRVALLAQDRAQRLGDVARRQRAGRDLVEQRLEQVEVAPVDQGQADLRVDAQAAAPRTARRTRHRRSTTRCGRRGTSAVAVMA